MATFVNDTLTDAVGAALSAHIGETGATWAKGSSFTGVASPVFDSTGGRVRANQASNAFLYTSGIAQYDGEYVEGTIDVVTNIDSFGIAVRTGAARGYFAHFGGGIARILRLESNGSFTTLTLTTGGTSVNKALTVGTHTVRITATGTGANVHLAVKFDGADLIAADDSSASRITTLGSAGVLMNGNHTDTTGLHITALTSDSSAPSTAVSFTLTDPADGRVYQRSGTTGTIVVNGTYTGTPGPIEAQLVQDGTSTVLSGFAWQTVVASPTGGSFSFSFAGVPQGGWYNVQLRDSTNTSTAITSGKVGVGALVATFGQSPAMKLFRVGDSTLTPDPKLRMYGNIGSWVAGDTATMNGAISLGNALVAALGVPVGLLDYGIDGSGLVVVGSGYEWVPTSGAAYTSFKNGINSAGGKFEQAIWAQGETDAKASVAQADYYNGLGTLFAQVRSDFGANLPIVLVMLGRRLDGLTPDASTEAIKMAQVQKCADTGIYRVERNDLPVSSDNIHQTPAGFTTLGARCANAIKFILGLVTSYRGPSIASVLQVDSTTYDVSLAHHAGTDFTPTTGITGFNVTDPGASNAVIAVNSAVHQAAATIRLTLASAPVSLPNVGYMYGSNPVVTGAVKDNSTLTLPLEYSASIGAATSQAIASGAALGSVPSIAGGTAAGTSNASISGASLTGVCSFSAGSAIGASAGVANGAALTATSVIIGGTAVGTIAATAPGASMAATSTFTPASASGSSGGVPDASAISAARTVNFDGGTNRVNFDGGTNRVNF